MFKLNARIGRAVAIAGGLALGLLAGGAIADDAVTLNVWSDTPRLTMFDLYDKTHDKVTLNVTTVAPTDLIAKLQLAMQAKSQIPDVIFMSDIGYTAQLGPWKLRGFGRVDNLTGRAYAGSVIVNEGNARFFEPAPGRTWLVGVASTLAF